MRPEHLAPKPGFWGWRHASLPAQQLTATITRQLPDEAFYESLEPFIVPLSILICSSGAALVLRECLRERGGF